MPIFSAWKGRRGFGRASSDGPQQQPTMRQVLNALDAGEPVHWIPAGVARAGRKPAPRSRRVLYLAALAVCLTPGGAWLATHPTAKLENGVLAAAIFPRLEQIASTVRSPLEQVTVSAKSGQPLPALVVGDAIAVEAGRRGYLPAHVANSENVQPETIVLVNGLPDSVRLSEGIMIRPGLWMLRPDLLVSVELDAAANARGRYDLTLELRTPEGTIISAGRTVLVIAPARNVTVPKAVAKEGPVIERAAPMPPRSSVQADAVNQHVTPSVQAVRKQAAVKKRVPLSVAAPERNVDKTDTKPKLRVAKPLRVKPQVQSEVTILAAKPVVRPPPRQQPLVWPGDDPRSASNAQMSPLYLGGFVSEPQAQSRARRR
ncbi:MAG: hypothetical protein ABWZ74_06390 [Hyphomicrobiaceae bacterium]